MPQQDDWAKKKASQFDWLDHDTIVQIAHALRLERARAVRVCLKLKRGDVFYVFLSQPDVQNVKATSGADLRSNWHE